MFERFTVTGEYARATIHSVYGKVVISVTPALPFSFRSEAAWPRENYQDAVLKGILDVLEDADVSQLGAELVLEEIGWRNDEYCWDSYYQTTKRAAWKILQKLEVASSVLSRGGGRGAGAGGGAAAGRRAPGGQAAQSGA